MNSDAEENVSPAWDSFLGSLSSLKTNQLFSVVNFHLFSNLHFADILPSSGLKLGGLQGTVLSEIFFNVLINFFGRSPGSRYMQNHRKSCCKYVSSKLMRPYGGKRVHFYLNPAFQVCSILDSLHPSGLPDCSETGRDEA